MKKQLITSICTLVLSLLGAFGLNQNTLNSNADYVATESVEDIQNINNNQSLYGDNQTNAAEADADAAEVTDTDKVITDSNKANTDKTKATDKKNNVSAQLNNNVANNNSQNTVSAAKNTESNKQQADSKASVVNQAGNTASAANQARTQATPVASLDTSKCRIVNGQVFYGNINLSNCKSINDVVNVLNSNGYNISAGNMQNAKSLEDILAKVNKSSGNMATSKPSNTATTPSKVPTATPAPANSQTSKPASSGSDNAASNTSLSSYASEVLRLVNVERAKAGLPALTTNSTLTTAANKRAQEIKQTFSHTRPNGTSCFTVLGEYGVSYRTAGENIAYGQKTPQEVVNGWMNSPGHRANILKSSFGKVGIGVYQSGGVYYWTQLFTD